MGFWEEGWGRGRSGGQEEEEGRSRGRTVGVGPVLGASLCSAIRKGERDVSKIPLPAWPWPTATGLSFKPDFFSLSIFIFNCFRILKNNRLEQKKLY